MSSVPTSSASRLMAFRLVVKAPVMAKVSRALARVACSSSPAGSVRAQRRECARAGRARRQPQVDARQPPAHPEPLLRLRDVGEQQRIEAAPGRMRATVAACATPPIVSSRLSPGARCSAAARLAPSATAPGASQRAPPPDRRGEHPPPGAPGAAASASSSAPANGSMPTSCRMRPPTCT